MTGSLDQTYSMTLQLTSIDLHNKGCEEACHHQKLIRSNMTVKLEDPNKPAAGRGLG